MPVRLGDVSTGWKNVEKFYEWWRTKFVTWRDFSSMGEYDLKDSESRDEKRWMEKKNKKAGQKRAKEENIRIITLVENSFRADPRVAAHLNEEKNRRKEKLKQRQEEAKLRRQAETKVRQQREAEEKLRVEEEARVQEELRIARQQQLAALEAKRTEFRSILSNPSAKFHPTTEQLEKLAFRLDVDALSKLNQDILSAEDGGRASVNSILEAWAIEDKKKEAERA